MREFRFRAWNKKKKKMYYTDYAHQLDFLKPGEWIFKNSYTSELFDDKCGSVMQWTGLQDKNGKSIYEGDLLGFRNATKNPSSIMEVFFKDGCFCTRFLDGRKFYGTINKDVIKTTKIIGNVFENSELIGDEE